MNVTLDETSQAEWQQQKLEPMRYDYPLSPDDFVFDVGAYRGEWATQIYSRYQCHLIVIEPGPWIKGFPIGEVINKAASDSSGVVSFGGDYYYSSAHEPSTHQYPAFDINHLIEEFEEIALMKINIEGDEYRLLKHILGAGLQKRIKNFQVQFHQIANQPYELWYEEIVQLLSQTHYPSWRYKFCWENWSRIDAGVS